MSDRFKALWATENDEGKAELSVRELGADDLPEGEVTVGVRYSTVNYKDGLAVMGNKSRIMRRLPMAPGIDYVRTQLDLPQSRSHVDADLACDGPRN